MFKKLINKLLGKQKIEKASRIWGYGEEFSYATVADVFGMASGGIPQPRNIQGFDALVKYYGNNVWIYAAVYQIAVSIASVPLIIYKKKHNTLTKDPISASHPLVRLFTRPNPFMSLYDLKEALIANLELTGNAYIEEVYDKKGNLLELYPLQSHRVRVVPDPKQLIKGYIYDTNVKQVFFNADEITHIKYFNPTSDFYGMSPQSPGESSIMVDMLAKDWNKTFFKNSAIPRGALETDQNLSDAAVARLRKQWKVAHSGVAKSHEVAILEGGLRWRNIEISSKDMDFVNLSRKTRDEILTVFGVPAPILGIVENINNSVMENLKKIFWENTLLPKMEKLENSLNINLIWPNDDRVYVAFDKDAIEALKGSVESRARVSAMLVDRGIMTQNEVRQKFFGLPPVPWGNNYYMPLNLTPVDHLSESVVSDTRRRDAVPGRSGGRPNTEAEDLKELIARAIEVGYTMAMRHKLDNISLDMINFNGGENNEQTN